MMTKILQGYNVLITRPIEQAQNLGQRIVQLGGDVTLFPTIAIADLADQTAIHQQVKNLAQNAIAIFISTNAVQKSAAIIRQYWSVWPQQVHVAAIGATTAEALHAAGLPVDFCPVQHFNSEALLALPVFQHVTGKSIIIFRGCEGRQLLAATLRARGAHVTELAVYRRILPALPEHALEKIRKVNVIVSTSNTCLQNLLILVDASTRAWLQNMPLLVASSRIAAQAKGLGFVKQPVIADNATDAAIIDALLKIDL